MATIYEQQCPHPECGNRHHDSRFPSAWIGYDPFFGPSMYCSQECMDEYEPIAEAEAEEAWDERENSAQARYTANPENFNNPNAGMPGVDLMTEQRQAASA